jgi:2-oxoglutarate/2-oxoacid ferredoxin oxidoreductase subunit beta
VTAAPSAGTPLSLGLPQVRSGLEDVPQLPEGGLKQTKKTFTSGSEVRWCPGCGDYAILSAVQGFLPELGLRRENIVCISGIGCSSRFPYYLDTYGLHSIHGRAPSIATGLATTRPDLNVWVVTGDGDALSIGGNHLIHALRRNVNLTILLFNNRIYGLTKGQYSPTSEPGKVTKSTPVGSVDEPFNPISLALGAEATFVARTLDNDRKHLTGVLRQAVDHRGTALVEIYQNCPIFNDDAFEVLKDRDSAQRRLVPLVHGAPIRFGVPAPDGLGSRGVARRADGLLEILDLPDGAATPGADRVLVHDAHASDPSLQFALSRLDDPSMAHVPVGVFRSVARPTYDDMVRAQVDSAVEGARGPATDDDLAALIAGSDTWAVAPEG